MLEIKYTCRGCGTEMQPVKVRYRRSGEGIGTWMRRVCLKGVSQNHRARSPRCLKGVADLYIPVPEGGKGVGERP